MHRTCSPKVFIYQVSRDKSKCFIRVELIAHTLYICFLFGRNHGDSVLRYRDVPLHTFQSVHGDSNHDATDDANIGLCGGNVRLRLSRIGNLFLQAPLRALVRDLGNHLVSAGPSMQHFPSGVVGQSIPRAQDHQQNGFHNVVFRAAGCNFLRPFVALAVLE